MKVLKSQDVTPISMCESVNIRACISPLGFLYYSSGSLKDGHAKSLGQQ